MVACSSTGHQAHTDDTGTEIGYLVKSDVDTVADIHFQQINAHLESLAEKLYRRNPKFCNGGTPNITYCVKKIFQDGASLPGASKARSIESIMLAFDENFDGDRVFAFIFGLKTMILAAYGNKTEFYIADEFDPQKLYNSARNLEIAAWRLRRYRDKSGKLFLLSNGYSNGVANLSFERLFGKMVSLQDTMSMIIAESSRRHVKNVIQRLATAVFLPI